jgi:hypothetical protein
MFHGATPRHFVVNSVAKTGRSLNLAKGQWGVIDKDAQPDNNGLKVISNFDGLSKDSNVQLYHGSPEITPNRSFSNKSNRSIDFKLSEIEQIRVSAPKEGIEVDEQVLGYNGFDADSAIVLTAGADEEISIKLSGPALGILGYQDQAVIITERLSAPNGTKAVDAPTATAGAWTDQQVVEEAVERLKRTVVMGGIPLTDYVDITPVNSLEGAATGTDSVFYNLNVSDGGTQTDLGLVGGQYPLYNVVRSDSTSDGSVYTIVAPAATVLPAYSVNKAWKVKGCATCPAGYTQLSDGWVYSISLEDDGVSSAAAVAAISTNVLLASVVKVNEEGGLSTYTFVSSAPLTDAERGVIITANPEAIINLVANDVAELCSPNNVTTVAWVTGKTCKTRTETYTTIVGHDDCNVAPTAAIQAAYPELTITVVSSANCSTKYTTTVTTDVVCEECSAQFRGLFTSEAPSDYGVHSWIKAPKTYLFNALMGIRFKAKPFIFAGNEEYRDSVPQLATSTRIQVAGGYAVTVNQSFDGGSTAGRFRVTILSVASEPENWGLNLRAWEEASRIAFNGECRFYNNNYGNLVTGKETNLEAVQPYVDYVVKVRTKTRTQGFYGELNETIEYHMLVAPGVHRDVEDVLNALATQAGLKPVQAFGKTSA